MKKHSPFASGLSKSSLPSSRILPSSPLKTREHTQQGGFSAAVAADQAHNGAFPNGEIQAVDRDNLIEPFGKPFDFNQNITSLNKASR